MCYNFKKVPIEGYTHVYKHEFDTPWGEHRVDYVHGYVRETLEELDDVTEGAYEFDKTTHKHLGIAKIKIEMLDN